MMHMKGLNMFLVLQLLVEIEISPSLKLWPNFVPQLQNCVDLVFLTKFC